MANSTTAVGLRRALHTESWIAFGAHARLTQPTHLTEFVRGRRKQQLLALRGGLNMEDNWRELRALEIEGE